MKHMIDYYLTTIKIAIQTQFQYRVMQYFYMIGMIAEPVIYLVVWSTIARSAGRLGGRIYTPHICGLLPGVDPGTKYEHRLYPLWLGEPHPQRLVFNGSPAADPPT